MASSFRKQSRPKRNDLRQVQASARMLLAERQMRVIPNMETVEEGKEGRH